MASSNTLFAIQRLSGINKNERVIFSIGGATSATIQINQFQLDATPGVAAIYTIQRSNDGVNWLALSTPTTLNAAAMTSKLDVDGIRYISVYTSTVASGGGVTICNVDVCLFATGLTLNSSGASSTTGLPLGNPQ